MSLLTCEQQKQTDPICQSCPWFAKDYIGSQWNLHSIVAIVGDCPTLEDFMEGELFSGVRGDLLNNWLSQIGLHLDQVSKLSAVKCSSGEKRIPASVVSHCSAHLKSDIDYLKQRSLQVVVPLGAKATRGFFKLSKFNNVRGVPLRMRFGHHDNSITVLPSLSPAHILSKHGELKLVEKDFDVLRRLISGVSLAKLTTESSTVVHILNNFQRIQRFFKELPGSSVASIDIETTGYNYKLDKVTGDPLNYLSGDLLTINFSIKEGEAYILPLLGYKAKQLWSSQGISHIYEGIRISMHLRTILWILHNASFDLKFLHRIVGIDILKVRYADTMLMSHLLWEESPKDLKRLAHIHTSLGGYESVIKGTLGHD